MRMEPSNIVFCMAGPKQKTRVCRRDSSRNESRVPRITPIIRITSFTVYSIHNLDSRSMYLCLFSNSLQEILDCAGQDNLITNIWFISMSKRVMYDLFAESSFTVGKPLFPYIQHLRLSTTYSISAGTYDMIGYSLIQKACLRW